MNRRAKAALIAMAVAPVLLVIAAGWVAFYSRDVPAPDVSALRVETVEAPDEDNAYVYFEKTLDGFQWLEDRSRVNSILMGKESDDDFVTELLSRSAQTLALLKRGLVRPAYQPHVESRLQAPRLPYFWSHDIGLLLALEAMREKRSGRVPGAWELCLERCRLSSMVATCPRGIVEAFAALAALNEALDDAAQLVGESAPQETELVGLLEALNRIGPLDRGVVRALKEEFQFIAEVIDRPYSTRACPRLLRGYVYQPNRTKQMCAEFLRAVASTAPQPYSQVRVPEFNPLPTHAVSRRLMLLGRNGAGRVLAAMLTSPDTFRRLIMIKCSAQSRLDGLRLIAACQLYEIRHGRLPETLEALVPEYFSDVPRDPFDGKPFRYLPERAVVYSVGKDLRDSSGSVPPVSDAHPSTRVHPKSDDLVYDVHGKSK